jgi:hypothetical protein
MTPTLVAVAAGLLLFLGIGLYTHYEVRSAELPAHFRILEEDPHFGVSGILVFHDDVRKVTCWELDYTGPLSGGPLSCIPDTQLNEQ